MTRSLFNLSCFTSPTMTKKRIRISRGTKVAGVIALAVFSVTQQLPRISGFIDSFGLGARSEEKQVRACQPCDARPSLEPLLFFSNSTRELLDPVDGPLAFGGSNQQADPASSWCPPCPAADVILSFVDDAYLDSLSVWLHYYKLLDHSRRILCLFALSDSSFHKLERLISSTREKFLEDFGQVVVVHVQQTLPKSLKGSGGLWAYRIRTLNEFLHSFPSFNLLFTDLDALWLRDPHPLYSFPPDSNQRMPSNSLTRMDIVASRATFPPECSLLRQSKEKNHLTNIGQDGGTAVFGFIYFHNTPATRKLAAELANQASTATNTNFDDQVALNCRLYNRYNLSRSTILNDGSFLLQYDPPPSEDDMGEAINLSTPLGLRLISGSQAVRHCTQYRKALHHNATVAHCLSPKDGMSKMKEFLSFNLLPMTMTMYDWGMAGSTHASRLGTTGGNSHTGYFNDSETGAFTLAVRRFQIRSSSIRHKTAKNLHALFSAYGMHPGPETQILNSVRVPKAGSSSLSIIARALAGCLPDGFPACKFPGDPPGSCPRTGLMCPRVKGHVDHRPNFDDNGQLPSITSLRDPVRRLLSSFFYTKPHRPEPASDHRWETFAEYIRMPKYRNVITKMLSGDYAYHNFDERIHTVEKAKGRLCQMSWFYIIGMETAGELLLYETSPFDKLEPNPVVFDLPAEVVVSNATFSITRSKTNVGLRRRLADQDDSSNYTVPSDSTGKRRNDDSDYDNFRKNVFVENNGATLIREHNEEDFELYEFARELLCAKLGRSGILEAVATLVEDDSYGSFHPLKERIKKEVDTFCPNGATVQPVERFCPI